MHLCKPPAAPAVDESEEASADDQVDDEDDEDFGSKPRATRSAGRSSRPSNARATAVSPPYSLKPAPSAPYSACAITVLG